MKMTEMEEPRMSTDRLDAVRNRSNYKGHILEKKVFGHSRLKKQPGVGCQHFVRTFFWVPAGTINRDRPEDCARNTGLTQSEIGRQRIGAAKE